MENLDFVFEASVGAKLLQVSSDIYYWRQGNYELDFVLRWQDRLYAVEVKSGKRHKLGGLETFLKLFPEAVPVIISRDNYEGFVKDPGTFLKKC